MNPQDIPDYRTSPKIVYNGKREWTRRILATILVATVFGTAGFCGGKTTAKPGPCVESMHRVGGACNLDVSCKEGQSLVKMDDYSVLCACPKASASVLPFDPVPVQK